MNVYYQEEELGNTNWINVSGGKDSTALLLWSLEEELPNCRYVYADTQHEHPAVYEYLEYLERETGVTIERLETEGFLELCKRKQRFPSSQVRFCTQELKIFPMAHYMNDAEDWSADNPHLVWVGIRAEESLSRAQLSETSYMIVRKSKDDKNAISFILRHHPLIDWYSQDVFDIHKKHGIEPNPLYKMGMHRVGCFPCILATKPELRKMFKRFPEMVDKIREWETLVAAASKRGDASFFPTGRHTPEGGPCRIDDVVANLDQGPELPGLEQDVQGCMSIYGLCE